MRLYIITFLLLFVQTLSWAAELSVVVKDDQGQVFPGVVVMLNGKAMGLTDFKGEFFKANLPTGKCVVHLDFMGFIPVIDTLVIEQGKNTRSYQMQIDAVSLDEFSIAAESVKMTKEKEGFSVDVMETKEAKNLNQDLTTVIKSTPGINVRSAGGLGSGFDISLNGLSGNQIKYFIDGVPLENYGQAMALNNFPLSDIERLEVYKGVVPIELASDALGGAINIVTNQSQNSYIDASYSAGSFNTHRATLDGQYFNKEHKYYIKTSGFFNYSDNNYMMYGMPVYDLELGNKEGEIDVERNHDQYQSYLASAEFGLVQQSWADAFSVKLSYADFYKEYMHPDNNILRPFVGFHAYGNTALSAVQYKKKVDKFTFKAYASYAQVQQNTVDTSNYRTNWAGDIVERPEGDPKGELYERKTWFRMTDEVYNANAYVGYELTEYSKLELNANTFGLERNGEDFVDEYNTSFTDPASLGKSIIGLGYALDKGRWNLSAFGKQYWYNGYIAAIDPANELVVSEPHNTETGYGFAAAFVLTEKITVKSSFEKAYRFPESYEILGDGVYVTPNPELQPETSYNPNVAVRYNSENSQWRINSEIKWFYRYSKDFIRFNPLGPFGSYENIDNVSTNGIEYAISADYKNRVNVNFNFTYQNILDQSEFDEGLPNSHYQDKIPNVPYLFGGARIGVKPFTSAKLKSFTVYYGINYVHEFFLTWESAGSYDTKNIIPTQLTHNLEFNYAIPKSNFNTSLAVNNLTDALVYDNFNIQKPGRAIYLKLRYKINFK